MNNEVLNAISDPAFFRYMYDEMTPGEQCCSKAEVRIERHNLREILMTVAGETDFILDGKCYRAVPGCVFFIDHWVPHKLYYCTNETDFIHIWIHLRKDKLVGGTYTDIGGVAVVCRDIFSLPSELYCLLNKRWELMKGSPDNSLAKKTLQKYMIKLLCVEMELNWKNLHDTRSNNDLIEQVQNYIEMNHGRNSSLAELEKFSGYSRYHLLRLFKAQTGFTILQYVNQVRRRVVEEAQKRNISQKEIAFQLGFSSPAAFWLWKKRIMET